jgi:hypothetical protein
MAPVIMRHQGKKASAKRFEQMLREVVSNRATSSEVSRATWDGQPLRLFPFLLNMIEGT